MIKVKGRIKGFRKAGLATAPNARPSSMATGIDHTRLAFNQVSTIHILLIIEVSPIVSV
jgi:hypothetical protein